MIKVDQIDIWGFDHAIRGMRNPMNSWDKSDSVFETNWKKGKLSFGHECTIVVGPNDLDLMRRLYAAGSEHRKYLRQIFVSMDITAPLYWWKEFDTYKVGTVANSCSTMHKIHEKGFVLDDFSHEHLIDYDGDLLELFYEDVQEEHSMLKIENPSLHHYYFYSPHAMLELTINMLNYARQLYLETKDKKYWWQMIQLLPSSYNQKRTVTMNYENVMNIIDQRSNHKLDEWREFVDTLKTLPYVNDIRKENIHG